MKEEKQYEKSHATSEEQIDFQALLFKYITIGLGL